MSLSLRCECNIASKTEILILRLSSVKKKDGPYFLAHLKKKIHDRFTHNIKLMENVAFEFTKRWR